MEPGSSRYVPFELAATRALVRGRADEARDLFRRHPGAAGRFVRFAERQRIAGLACAALSELGVAGVLPAEKLGRLLATYRADWAQNQRLSVLATKLGTRLGAKADDLVFLKGPFLAARVHGDLGRRNVSDLDLLVRWSDVRAVEAELVSQGFERVTRVRFPRFLARPFVHHFAYTRRGLVVEIHWALQRRAGMRVDHDAVRARAVESGADRVRVAALEDELLLQAISAFTDLQRGTAVLRSFVDQYAIARQLPADFDWNALFARWRRDGVGRFALAMLGLAIDLLGAAADLPQVASHLRATGDRTSLLSRALGEIGAATAPSWHRRLRWIGLSQTTALAAAAWWLASLPARLAVHAPCETRGTSGAWRVVGQRVQELRARRHVRKRRQRVQTPFVRRPYPIRRGHVFVAIASYRDIECQRTVADLFAKAARPERVSVGICWQIDRDTDRDCFMVPTPRPAQVRTREVAARDALGVCWARYETQRLWRGEEFVLQIDSHMRFAERWDEKLLADLGACDSPKPVLSCYPPAFEPGEPLDPRAPTTVLAAQEFDEHGGMRFQAMTLDPPPERPPRGAFVAGGFLCAPAEILLEVPYDPYLAYCDEEIALAARLFTHGWDAYGGRQAIVYHLYREDARRRAWVNDPVLGLAAAVSRRRLHHLLGMESTSDREVVAELDTFGLGTVRSLAEFERFCGIEFATRLVSEDACNARFGTAGDATAPVAAAVA